MNLQEEKKKPLDLSDVMTPRGESIKAELIRVRTLLANTEFTPVPEAGQGDTSGEPPVAEEVRHFASYLGNGFFNHGSFSSQVFI